MSCPALKERAADTNALEKQPVNSLLLLSRMLIDADDRPTAAAVLRVARRHFPRDFWVCLTQGTVQITGGPKPDLAEAVCSYAAAVALRPQSSLAHARLADAFKAEKKFAEAIGELREAAQLKPDNADAQLTLGYVLEETGKLDAAIGAYRRRARAR